MSYTQANFPQISSEPSQCLTWLIRIVFAFVMGTLLLGLLSVPFLIYDEKGVFGFGLIFLTIVYYAFLCVILYLLVKLIIKNKNKAVHTIIVNNQGIFYKKHDGSAESILYKDLQRSGNNRLPDILTESFAVDGRNTVYLKAFYDDREILVDFQRIDVAFGSYAQNHRKLRSHFLNGIKIFRPDLSIDPLVYNEFFINPETFQFEKK